MSATEPLSTPEHPDLDALLGHLTLDEKASLTGGDDVWHLPALTPHGIGRLKMSDGPSGVRGQHMGTRRSLSFPCGIAVAATWDVELVGRYGAALAEEARAKGVHLLLGPTVGIVRTPLGGRTFESFSEDPVLSAELAVAYVRAVQAAGVGCCVKHFALNDQELDRMSINVEVDEPTLRELHLPAFEAAVRRGGAWSIMSAYNRFRGAYCGENTTLLTDILRTEWGFDGVVVSDWFGTHSVEAAEAGLDVEMPGPAQHLGADLATAVRNGAIDESLLDEIARRILRLIQRVGLDGELPPAEEPQDPEDDSRRPIARELAIAGTVLLRNEDVLPIIPSIKRIALIGPSARRLETGGGGSSRVVPRRQLDLLDELRTRLPGAEIVHEPGISIDRGVPLLTDHLMPAGLHIDYFASPRDTAPVASESLHGGRMIALGDPVPGVPVGTHTGRATGTVTADLPGTWIFGLTSTGTARLLIDGEPLLDTATATKGGSFFGLGTHQIIAEVELAAGRQLELSIEYESTGEPIAGFEIGLARPHDPDMMDRALAAAAEADLTIVVVGSTSQWETEGTDRSDLRLVGDQDQLVANIAAVNPRTVVVLNGGSPVEMPWIDDIGALLVAWYPGEEGAPALASILVGESDPGGRLPLTFPRRIEDNATHGDWYPGQDGTVTYGEGLLVGYRHHDTNDVDPLFPFGAGRSYTDFDHGDAAVEQDGYDITITVPVTNIGPRQGREVVQLYLGRPAAPASRPVRELKGFAPIDLDPGEQGTVTMRLDERSLAWWDTDAHDWRVMPGTAELSIGASSRDLRQTVRVELP